MITTIHDIARERIYFNFWKETVFRRKTYFHIHVTSLQSNRSNYAIKQLLMIELFLSAKLTHRLRIYCVLCLHVQKKEG